MEKLSSDIESLQATADVAFIQNHLRRTAGRQLIYAGVLLAQALLKYPDREALPLLGLALVLGFEAMWLLHVRKPQPVLYSAILLWIAAALNVYPAILQPASSWSVFVLFNAYVGFREFRLYRRFRSALASETPESQAELESIISTLGGVDSRSIQPHIDGDRWVARLYENGIVLRDTVRGSMLFAPRDRVTVERKGNSLIGGFAQASMVVGNRKLSCSLRPEEAGRLIAWSGGQIPADVVSTW